MRKNRSVRRLLVLAAATISVGVAAPVGFAQYGEEPPPVVETPQGNIGFIPIAPVTPDTSVQLKKCIKKAKKKFRNDPVKKKNAIKTCKKKYG